MTKRVSQQEFPAANSFWRECLNCTSKDGQRRTLNAPIAKSIRNPQSKLPGGRVELPTNPESFRGCSTAATDKLLIWHFSSALRTAQSFERRQALPLPSLRQSRVCRQFASWLPCDPANVAQTEYQGRQSSRYNVAQTIHAKCRPKP